MTHRLELLYGAGEVNITPELASTRIVLDSPSAVLPRVVMKTTSGTKRVAGDERGCRTGTEGGKGASTKQYQRAFT